LVAGPTAWTSGDAIIYNIPDGIAAGAYYYTVNFTDDSGNWYTDSVNFTVEINAAPVINSSPGSINVEFGYTGHGPQLIPIQTHTLSNFQEQDW